jgi:hypothetical protein
LGLLGDPDGGRFLYHCSTLGQDGTQAYWSDGTVAAPYGLSVEAVGRNGVLYAMDSETFDWVTWDGHDVHAVQDMPGSFTISAQAHELGFWVSSYHDRWFVAANGSATLEGNLAPSPQTSNGGESGGVFDRQGRYYEKQSDKDDHWYIVRRPLSPGVSEILYADDGAPAGGSDFAQTPPLVHVYVERGRFVTAP